MLEPWMWQLTLVLAGPPVAWALTVAAWWALADAREAWRDRLEAYADEHDEEYDAPELPASRPSLVTYLRALTLATGGSTVLMVALLGAGQPFKAGVFAWLTVSFARSLRTQLRVMRESAGHRVPTV